ncbi:MAG TPA: DUF559 domain-containing protein [Allosphingosinicella sp.]
MPRVPPRLVSNARELRRSATDAERAIWRILSPNRLRFTRQHVVGPYIIDLACRRAKVAVEFDGSQHIDRSSYDAKRTEFLQGLGWTVLRFWNSEVADNPDGVAEAILIEVNARLAGTHP